MPMVQRDVNSEVAGVRAFAAVASFTASSTSNTDTFTGVTIDRLGYTRRYLSASVMVPVSGALHGSSATAMPVRGTLGVQDSADASSWTNLTSERWPAATIFGATTAGATSTAYNGVVQGGFNLTRARRYVRFLYTPTLQSSSSGTANTQVIEGGVAVMGGAETLPALV